MVEAERNFAFETGNTIKTGLGSWKVVGVFINSKPPSNVIADLNKSYWSVTVEPIDNHALTDGLEFPFPAIVNSDIA